jgi:hypothetical protein
MGLIQTGAAIDGGSGLIDLNGELVGFNASHVAANRR